MEVIAQESDEEVQAWETQGHHLKLVAVLHKTPGTVTLGTLRAHLRTLRRKPSRTSDEAGSTEMWLSVRNGNKELNPNAQYHTVKILGDFIQIPPSWGLHVGGGFTALPLLFPHSHWTTGSDSHPLPLLFCEECFGLCGGLAAVGYRPSFLASWFSKDLFYTGGWRVIHLYVVH